MNRTPCTVVNMEANVGRLCTHQQTSQTTHNIRTPLKNYSYTFRILWIHSLQTYIINLDRISGLVLEAFLSRLLFVSFRENFIQIIYILNLNFKFKSYSGEVRSWTCGWNKNNAIQSVR